MKKLFIHLGVACLLAYASLGCSTTTAERLNQLALGMSQAQVKNILGNHYIAKASRTDSTGSRLEMWEYTDKKTKEAYRVYFKDGELAQWGQRGNLDFPDLNLPK